MLLNIENNDKIYNIYDYVKFRYSEKTTKIGPIFPVTRVKL